jgi:nucleoside-diphosphate-sugar epimerase
VVGAGGWLGLATVELLHRLLGERFTTQVVCFGSRARPLVLRDGLIVEQHALEALGDLPRMPTIVLHLAFLTQEKANEMSHDDYVEANRAISSAVLGALDRIGAEKVFLPSSGAVYAVGRPSASAALRLYAQLKLQDEKSIEAWARERGGAAVIARVFNLSGPYINKQTTYALACFVADALAGRAIAIRSTRRVYRSYVAISELMSVVIGALTEDVAGAIRFDTAGEFVYEMADIAEIVRSVINGDLGVERPTLLNEDPDYYVGDGEVYAGLRRALGVEAVGFRAQVLETARFMSATTNQQDCPV